MDVTPSPRFAPASMALPPVDLPAKANYHIDINPEVSSGLKAAKDFMSNTLEKAKGFNERRGMVDERITHGANEHQLTTLADKLAEETTVGFEKAKSALAASTANVEARVNAKVALTPTANASEVRAVMRAMPVAERSAALAAAFKAGDKEVIAAIVSAPAFIHGCNPEQVTALHEAYKRDVAYAEYRELDEHTKGTRHLENFFPGLGRWQASLYRGTKNHAKKHAQHKAILASYGIELGDD